MHGVRLRLYHHSDGARVAYRELGAGPPLALLHSALLSHKEWEPAAEQLASRFRVVLPDLPGHGDSEQRPGHPYTIDWLAEVFGGFADEVLVPRPLLAGHVAGNAQLARSWAKLARGWPVRAQRELLDLYPRLDMPVLLLWADRDQLHPLRAAEEALELLPQGQLRVLESTGFLMAYDDPVGLARELV